jgi:hypothetical protein
MAANKIYLYSRLLYWPAWQAINQLMSYKR